MVIGFLLLEARRYSPSIYYQVGGCFVQDFIGGINMGLISSISYRFEEVHE